MYSKALFLTSTLVLSFVLACGESFAQGPSPRIGQYHRDDIYAEMVGPSSGRYHEIIVRNDYKKDDITVSVIYHDGRQWTHAGGRFWRLKPGESRLVANAPNTNPTENTWFYYYAFSQDAVWDGTGDEWSARFRHPQTGQMGDYGAVGWNLDTLEQTYGYRWCKFLLSFHDIDPGFGMNN